MKGTLWYPDLRCGDWREVLADVGEVDAIVCDCPYSARTHGMQRTEKHDD